MHMLCCTGLRLLYRSFVNSGFQCGVEPVLKKKEIKNKCKCQINIAVLLDMVSLTYLLIIIREFVCRYYPAFYFLWILFFLLSSRFDRPATNHDNICLVH